MSTKHNLVDEFYDLDRAMELIVKGHRQWLATRVYYQHIKPFCDRHGLVFQTTHVFDIFIKDGREMDNNELDDLEGGSDIRDLLCLYFQDDLLISCDTLPFLTPKNNKSQEEPNVNADDLPF